MPSNLQDWLSNTFGGSAAGTPKSNGIAGQDTMYDFLLGRGGVDSEDFAESLTTDIGNMGLDPVNTSYTQGAAAQKGQLVEGARIRDETEARREERLGMLRGEQERASVPTISDQTIDVMKGRAAEQATADAEALMQSVRSHLGQSGVRGGAAHGLAAGVELQRLGAITGANRDLTIYKAQADAQDRLNRWQRSFQIGEVMGEEPSAFLYDTLQNIQESALFREGIIRQENAANKMADAQAKAGEQAAIGGAIGGVLGLAGSLFG